MEGQIEFSFTYKFISLISTRFHKLCLSLDEYRTKRFSALRSFPRLFVVLEFCASKYFLFPLLFEFSYSGECRIPPFLASKHLQYPKCIIVRKSIIPISYICDFMFFVANNYSCYMYANFFLYRIICAKIPAFLRCYSITRCKMPRQCGIFVRKFESFGDEISTMFVVYHREYQAFARKKENSGMGRRELIYLLFTNYMNAVTLDDNSISLQPHNTM